MCPAGVSSWLPLAIHDLHSSPKYTLNGLFIDTSRGCNRHVRPPGITAMWVFTPRYNVFVASVRCALNISRTNKAGLPPRDPGRFDQTVSIHKRMPLSSIHPLGWTCTTTPGGMISLGKVFRLKINIGGSLVPSAQQAKTAV